MGLQYLAGPLSASVFVWALAGLFVHCVVSLSARATSALKRYTAKQLLVAGIVGVASSATSGGRASVRAVAWLVRWWLLFFVLFLFFSVIHVTYTEFPETWTGAAQVYNGYLGPYVRASVLVPLRVLDLLLRALLPVWNSAVWFLKTLGVQGLLPILIEQAELVLRIATALVSLVRHLAEALTAFFLALFCTSGPACLRPEDGVLDLLTSMGDVREIAALGVQLVRAFCSTLAAPLDLGFYPLLDLNLAEAVHNLGNAALQLLVGIPRATAIRCAEQEANQFAVLMCTPDMAPFFNFLAAGLSSLGLAIDNWANVALLIVETVVGGDPPQCATADNALIPDLLAADRVFAGASGVAVVGLADWLYAVTDGVVAVYMGHNDGEQARLARWPYAVDPAFGIAAVSYSEVHEPDASTFSSGKTAAAMQTTAMLGCNCSDAGGEMRIVCAVLPMLGVPSEAARENYRLEVLFSDPSAPAMYACAGVDLYVRPVRWSYTRYETTAATIGTQGNKATLPTADCISRGTCRELDATVWLIPRCGQDVSANPGQAACVPTAPCFPFCMAARAAGSAGANLVLVRAARWRSGATILGQDCAMQSSTPETVQLGLPSQVQASRATRRSGGLLQTGSTEVYAFSSSQACVQNARISSVVPKLASQSSVTFNVRLDGQPFVVTGDTLLTAIELGGGAQSVQVTASFIMF